MFINKISYLLLSIQAINFADDNALVCGPKYAATQRYKNIGGLAEEKKLSINIDKTTCICFGKKKSRLALMNKEVSISSETKYLGLNTVENISYKSHIGRKATKRRMFYGIHFRRRKVIFTKLLKMDEVWVEHLQTAIRLKQMRRRLIRKSLIHNKRTFSQSCLTEQTLIFRASWTNILF